MFNLVPTIERTEQFFKTDLRYIARGFSWSVITQIIVSCFSLALSITISRYVPKDVYGQYKYVLSVVSILSILSLNNLGGAVLQSTARGFDGALPHGFRLNLKWSILVFIGAIGLSVYYFFGENLTLAIGILVGGCLTPFINGVNLYSNFLAGKKDFRRSSLYLGVAGTGFPVLFMIVTALIFPNPLALVLAYFISNILVDSYFYFRTKKVYKIDPANKDPHMLSYGKHLSLMGILGGIVGNIDQFMLFHFMGPVQVAIYSFSIGTLDQAKGPLKTMDSMMQARFANRDTMQIRENIWSKVLLVGVVSVGIIVVYIIAAPYLYHLLFPKYSEAILYTQIYSFTLLGNLQGPLNSYFSAHKKVRAQYINTVGSSCIQIAFIAIGILGWGLMGLVVARVLASITTSTLTFSQYFLMRSEQENSNNS